MTTRTYSKIAGTVCVAMLLSASTAPDAPVADAAMRGDTEAVRSLIRSGADVNTAQGDGLTALHWAGMKGDAEMAKILIYAGAALHAVTRNGAHTPLHVASQAGNVPVMRALLEAGGDANAISTMGVTPLHLAGLSGSGGAVGVLLDSGADVDARESVAGQTPLMFAASRNRQASLNALLERGADAAITTKIVDVVAVAREDAKARQERNDLLASLGKAAKRDYRQLDEREELEAEEEVRPLTFADLHGLKGGMTALLHAARQGHVESALALLEAGADVNQVSADHTSSLLIATINGHWDLGLLLLERGADPALASDAGNTPLYGALELQWAPNSQYPHPTDHVYQKVGYLEYMEAFLKAGVDPNVRLTKKLWYEEYNQTRLVDPMGATPFWRAAYATDIKVMKLLASYGADPQLRTVKPVVRYNSQGVYAYEKDTDFSGLAPVPVGAPSLTALHAASGAGYGEGWAGNNHRHVPGGWLPAVKYLVEEFGFDVNVRDHNGFTALHHAASRGDTEVIQYLVDQGADVTVMSRSGHTTVDMANSPIQRLSPFLPAVALLEELGGIRNHKCVTC